MADMTATLAALAEKVERLTEPSREVDAWIHVTIHGNRITHPRLPVGYTMKDQGTASNNNRMALSGFLHPHRGPAPTYTASIDAARTLLLPHHSFELLYSAAGEGAMRYAHVWDWRRSPAARDPGNKWEGRGKTLEGAFVAAALRARAASGEG
jgi:hypothetical protein